MSFIEKVDNLIALKGTTRNQVSKNLGLTKNCFNNWDNRGNIPDGDTLKKLAEYFEVTIDYLVGNDTTKTENTIPLLTEKEQLLLKLFRENESKQDSILDLLKK